MRKETETEKEIKGVIQVLLGIGFFFMSLIYFPEPGENILVVLGVTVLIAAMILTSGIKNLFSTVSFLRTLLIVLLVMLLWHSFFVMMAVLDFWN